MTTAAKLVLGLFGLGLVAIVMTTYTSPIEGAGTDPDLYNILAAALHQPGYPSNHPIGTTSLAVVPAADTAPSPDSLTVFSTQPREWAERAAAQDSAATQAWLGTWVIATGSTAANGTYQLTLHRIALTKGCPLLSSLTATYEEKEEGGRYIASLASTCPR